MKSILRWFWSFRPLFKQGTRSSYSQCGEDLIVAHALRWLDIQHPTYLDIGAFHPKYMNNTFHFYRRGARGVCIEPDPDSFRLLKLIRRRDTCLNVGVGTNDHATKAPFYLMSNRILNTFSAEDAQRYASYGQERIERVLQVSLLPINQILSRYFLKAPDFVSIDVEGLDLQILKSLDFEQSRPKIFCVETITYTEDHSERKLVEVIEFMQQQGYFLYADTYINSIFVDKRTWRNRGRPLAKVDQKPTP